eukprot:368398-Pleurochrysis_carterae.AAC.1
MWSCRAACEGAGGPGALAHPRTLRATGAGQGDGPEPQGSVCGRNAIERQQRTGYERDKRAASDAGRATARAAARA